MVRVNWSGYYKPVDYWNLFLGFSDHHMYNFFDHNVKFLKEIPSKQELLEIVNDCPDVKKFGQICTQIQYRFKRLRCEHSINPSLYRICYFIDSDNYQVSIDDEVIYSDNPKVNKREYQELIK